MRCSVEKRGKTPLLSVCSNRFPILSPLYPFLGTGILLSLFDSSTRVVSLSLSGRVAGLPVVPDFNVECYSSWSKSVVREQYTVNTTPISLHTDETLPNTRFTLSVGRSVSMCTGSDILRPQCQDNLLSSPSHVL